MYFLKLKNVLLVSFILLAGLMYPASASPSIQLEGFSSSCSLDSYGDRVNGVELSWNFLDEESHYNIFRDGVIRTFVFSNTNTYTDISIQQGNSYTYKIVGYIPKDGGGKEAVESNQITVSITDKTCAPKIVTAQNELPKGIIGKPFSFAFKANYGIAPYRWALLFGARLPQGLTLNENGILSGTPTNDGDFQFGAQVRDGTEYDDQKFFTLTIEKADQPKLQITPQAVMRGEQVIAEITGFPANSLITQWVSKGYPYQGGQNILLSHPKTDYTGAATINIDTSSLSAGEYAIRYLATNKSTEFIKLSIQEQQNNNPPALKPASLIIQNFAADKSNAKAGEHVRLQFTFKNTSGVQSWPFMAEIKLASDQALSSQVRKLKSHYFQAIAPNSWRGWFSDNYLRVYIPSDVVSGNYYIGVVGSDGLHASVPIKITQSLVACNYTYSDWSACQNDRRTRTIISKSPTDCIEGSPITSQVCSSLRITEQPKVENQDEEIGRLKKNIGDMLMSTKESKLILEEQISGIKSKVLGNLPFMKGRHQNIYTMIDNISALYNKATEEYSNATFLILKEDKENNDIDLIKKYLYSAKNLCVQTNQMLMEANWMLTNNIETSGDILRAPAKASIFTFEIACLGFAEPNSIKLCQSLMGPLKFSLNWEEHGIDEATRIFIEDAIAEFILKQVPIPEMGGLMFSDIISQQILSSPQAKKIIHIFFKDPKVQEQLISMLIKSSLHISESIAKDIIKQIADVEYVVGEIEKTVETFYEEAYDAKTQKKLNSIDVNVLGVSNTDTNYQIEAIKNETSLIINNKPEIIAANVGVKRDLSNELYCSNKYVSPLIGNNISEKINNWITNFVTYGTQTTLSLGQGERAGVVNSYKSAFDNLPESEEDLQDIIKISNGRWPSKFNPLKEKEAEKSFKKIYLRNPDRNNPNDDAAVTIMAYGLRSKRNLDSEKAAINSFEHIFKYSPNSATDWDTVRAIAYSGAKR